MLLTQENKKVKQSRTPFYENNNTCKGGLENFFVSPGKTREKIILKFSRKSARKTHN